MNLQFSRCTLADLTRIQHYGKATYEPYYPHIWRPGGMAFYMEHCFGTETLRTQLADPNIAYFLPQTPDGTVVGILKLHWASSVPDTALHNALYLEKIYLMPDFFGRGYGQTIMAWVSDMAAQLGREAIWLTVMHSGPEAAYLRAGFVRVGELRYDFDLILPEERGGWVMLKKM